MTAGAELGAVAELAAAYHGVVTRVQAYQFGLSSHSIQRLLRDGVLCEPLPGVLAFSAMPDTWLRRATAASAWHHGVGVIIGGSAARLHAIDGFDRSDEERRSITTSRTNRPGDTTRPNKPGDAPQSNKSDKPGDPQRSSRTNRPGEATRPNKPGDAPQSNKSDKPGDAPQSNRPDRPADTARSGGGETEQVHLALRRGSTSRSFCRVSQSLHTYGTSDITEVSGIRCSTLARTLVDLAQYAPERYERAVDDFQRRGFSLRWLSLTAERVGAMGRPGTNLIRTDLAKRAIAGTVRGSWFEQLAEACLRSPLLPGFERQFVVRDNVGNHVGRLDFAMPQLRLGFEADSRRWHTGSDVEAFDQRRENRLAEVGWMVQHLGWCDVTGPIAPVLHMIERIAAQRSRDIAGLRRS